MITDEKKKSGNPEMLRVASLNRPTRGTLPVEASSCLANVYRERVNRLFSHAFFRRTTLFYRATILLEPPILRS